LVAFECAAGGAGSVMTISSTALMNRLIFRLPPSADADSGPGVLVAAPAQVTMVCGAQILQRSLEPRDRLDGPICAGRFLYRTPSNTKETTWEMISRNF
jgi:hypothetical protein